MQISRSVKAIVILLNHAGAAHIPRHLLITSRPHSEIHDLNTMAVSNEGPDISTNIFPRAKTRDGGSCACRKKCPARTIINPRNCSKCFFCPPGTKPDPTDRICIPDGGTDDKDKKPDEPKPDEKKPEEKKPDETKPDEPKPDETKPDEKTPDEKTPDEKKAEEKRLEKEKKFGEKKQTKMDAYNAKEESKQDNDKRNKVRRMGRCIPLVALAMGAAVAAEFADEFFDEQYLESMDLMEFWPADFPMEPWDTEDSDKLFEEDSYMDTWASFGEEPVKRDLVSTHAMNNTEPSNKERRLRSRAVSSPIPMSTALALLDHNEKRFFFLIPIFAAIARTAAQIALAAVRIAPNIVRAARVTIRVGSRNASRRSQVQKNDGARKIASDRNFKQCLQRQGPL